MKTSKFYDQALSNTETSLNKLLLNLTGENYNVILKVA